MAAGAAKIQTPEVVYVGLGNMTVKSLAPNPVVVPATGPIPSVKVDPKSGAASFDISADPKQLKSQLLDGLNAWATTPANLAALHAAVPDFDPAKLSVVGPEQKNYTPLIRFCLANQLIPNKDNKILPGHITLPGANALKEQLKSFFAPRTVVPNKDSVDTARCRNVNRRRCTAPGHCRVAACRSRLQPALDAFAGSEREKIWRTSRTNDPRLDRATRAFADRKSRRRQQRQKRAPRFIVERSRCPEKAQWPEALTERAVPRSRWR